MMQEMPGSCPMKHASVDAMLHALVHEKGHRLNAPVVILPLYAWESLK